MLQLCCCNFAVAVFRSFIFNGFCSLCTLTIYSNFSGHQRQCLIEVLYLWEVLLYNDFMFEYFFTYGSELPSGVGFPMFGLAHFIWLAVGIVLTVLLAVWYKKAGGTRKLDLIFGIITMALLVVRYIYLAITRHLDVYELPFHLCALAGIFCFVHCFINWDWMGQVLYCLCLPGTIVALIFPDWNYYPPIHFITIQGFLFHFAVALYVICQLISGRIVPNIRKLWKVFVFLAITVPLLYIFNKHFDTNYFFVNVPSKGSPLEWIASFMGIPGYLLGYGVLAVLITSGLDLLYMAIRRSVKKDNIKVREKR